MDGFQQDEISEENGEPEAEANRNIPAQNNIALPPRPPSRNAMRAEFSSVQNRGDLRDQLRAMRAIDSQNTEGSISQTEVEEMRNQLAEV